MRSAYLVLGAVGNDQELVRFKGGLVLNDTVFGNPDAVYPPFFGVLLVRAGLPTGSKVQTPIENPISLQSNSLK